MDLNNDIALQFINEERTSIQSPRPYPMWKSWAENLAERLYQLEYPPAILLAEDLLWYRDRFVGWTPANVPTDEERSRIVTEFLVKYQEAVGKMIEFQSEKNKAPRHGFRFH